MEESVWRHSVETWLSAAEEEATRLPPEIAALRTAEQFIICNARLWWHADGKPCARALVRNGFTAANLPATAHASFERFLMILVSASGTRPDIQATSRRKLSADEARLLRAVSLCQEGYSCNAVMQLRYWLPPTAVRVALRNLTAFSVLAALEGLVLPLRSGSASPDAAVPMPSRAMMH